MTTQHGLSSPAMKDDNEKEREVEVEVDIEQDDVRAADSIIGEIQTGTPSPPATQLVTRPRKRHKREQCCINWGCTLPDRHAGLCNHVNDDTPRGYFPVKPSDILAGRRVRVLWRKCSKEYDGFIGEVQQILLHDGRPGARFRVNYDDDGVAGSPRSVENSFGASESGPSAPVFDGRRGGKCAGVHLLRTVGLYRGGAPLYGRRRRRPMCSCRCTCSDSSMRPDAGDYCDPDRAGLEGRLRW